jgi:FixJ family two-component response regulator
MTAVSPATSGLRHPTSPVTPTVYVVDGDASVRRSLGCLIRAADWQPETISSAEEFLKLPRTLAPACLLLDVALPGMSGLELQKTLADRPEVPVIFMSACSDVSITVRAMKAGALEFLSKPWSDEVLLSVIRDAIALSNEALGREKEMRALRERYSSLSPRERQVMRLVISGRLNKQVSGDLGITEFTVKIHRGRLMRKMQANSFAELVIMGGKLHIVPPTNKPQFESIPLSPHMLFGNRQAEVSF